MKTNLRYSNICLRALALLCLMMTSVGAWAQTYYVFQNGTYGYLVNNGTNNVGLNTTFSPSAVWIANAALGTTSRNIRSYIDESKYMNGTTGGAFTLGYSSSVWRMANNYLQLRSGSSYYVKYSGTAFTMNSTANNGNRFTVYVVDDISKVNSSLSSFTISGGTDEMTATGSSPAFNHGTSTYTPQRTNYHFNNADHYVNGTTATVTYAWALSGIESTYAEVDNAGKVTYKTLIPERERTVTLTCTATAGGLTQTATKEITFVNSNILYSPSISYDNAAGGRVSVTLSYPESDPDVKLYYTTNGSTPSASSTLYTAPFDVASNTTIKVIAVKGSTTSGVVSEVVTTISSGVSNGKVVLYDYEDHNWTYYQPNGGVDASYAYPDQLCSPYPRNVKITYYGNGTNTVSTSADANPAANTFTASTNNSVAVSRYETENTFVYYKTLEREGTTGRFPYELIPNPFSKRPVYTGNGSTNDNKWRGFYGWRIKSISNGTVHSAATGGTQYNEGSIITAEYATLYFQPTDNTMTNANNATSMEVEFEAVWARAYRVAGNTGALATNLASTTLQTGVSYERNFVVVNDGNTGAINTINNQRPATIMMIEPDGSTDYRTTGRYISPGNIIANNVLKIEWCNLRAGHISANNYDMILGRGIMYNAASHTAGDGTYGTPGDNLNGNYISTIGRVESNTATTYTNTNTRMRVESGVYTDLNYLCRQGQGLRGTASGSVYTYGIVGNDYDRAKNDGQALSNNTRLRIRNHISQGVGGGGATFTTGNHSNNNRKTFDLVIKSGYVGSNWDATINNGTYRANYEEVVYIGVSTSTRTCGFRYLTMEGGNIAAIAGGCDQWANDGDNPTTEHQENPDFYNRPSVNIRIRGNAIVRGPLYAGAANARTYGARKVIMTGGTIKGWLAAGCNGTSDNGGINFGPSYLYVGGTGQVNSGGSNNMIEASQGGNVFGAGSGRAGNNQTGRMRWGTNVVVADDAIVERNVYGGGNMGYASEYTKMFLTGGTVHGTVFGGSNQKPGDKMDMLVTGGVFEGGIYGGSNVTGAISNYVKMDVFGGQIGLPSAPANIHGGGYGRPTNVVGNVELTIGKSGATTGPLIFGDVYGGSALGQVNANATITYNTDNPEQSTITGISYNNGTHTYVTMNKGTINGSLYGGALGSSTVAANVYGPVQVKVYGGSVNTTSAAGSGAVYGANNINGAPQRSVTVDIYGTDPAPSATAYALDAVYGGGNQANYTYGNGYPKVTVHNCDNSIGYVYGGGNAAAVAATDVTIYGGNKIGNVFGGGNGQVRAANVNGNTNVRIYGGTIGDVYGGSNTNGTIGGTISVNVNAQKEDGAEAACPIDIDNVYGGGNQADSKAGNVTIGCAEHIGAVYGGANQANINGNINLSIVSGHIDNVFGGNNTSGNISGTITVTVNDNNSACGMLVGNVYGGGNKAAYGTGTNYPVVNIQNGHLTGSVFGGGLGETAVVTGNPQVTIGQPSAGTVHIDGNVFGGGDAANVVGKPVVLVQNCSTVIGTKDGEGNWNAVGGTVYGGGNAAHVTGAGNGTSVTINGGDINRVFGGGNGEVSPANVQGDAVTTIHAGNIHQAFAGSNMQGSIGGSASITIDHDGTCDELVDEVYGGGNEAAGSAGAVNIECGAIVGDVYGGANQADVNSDITLNITGGTIDRVFGGNNTSGNITGQITVNVDKGSCELSLGDVFGAGNLAQYAGGPIVNIKNGTVTRNVYGGGKGDPEDHTKGQVTGDPLVTIGDISKPGSVATVGGDVYGGGDAGNVVGTPQVRVPAKTNTTIANVYGGGNAADVSGTDLLIDGGTITGMVFGGGHGSKDDPATPETEPTVAANVNGDVQLYVTGGTINKVFAGSNANGNITGSVDFQIAKGNTSNEMHISEVYGGGNEAAGNAGTILIGCTGSDSEGIGDVYGGANAADINSDITLTITGGRINNVFGGNNTSGDIKGDIEVNIAWDGSCGNSRIGNVYGGGNLATYGTEETPRGPVVNIKNGTISQNVYGGGKGDPADHTKGQITGAPVVNIGDNTEAGWVAHVVGDVYGGGDAGNVVGTPQVNIINKCNTVIDHDVYGGGNAADVSSTDVNIDGGTITGMVFGGGHGDLTSEPQKEANVGGDVHVDITGGTIGKVFGGSNSKGNITGTINLNINKEDGHCDMHITEVYGGGNLAAGNAGTILIGCTGGDSEGIGDVYGGANAADINNAINLTIKGGRINRVFGGNNASGSITGPITVNVDWDDELTCGKYLGDVFGGGNLADYANATTVNMKKGTVNHIYGGGNEAGVGSATVNMLGGDVLQGLYGGCNTSGTVTGNIAVNVTGGQVGTDAEHKANVHGGGYGSATGSNGNVDVAVSGGVLFGDVYGGSALGNVNGTSADASKHTNVSVSGGTINGNVYGGGLGSKSPLTEAKEYGTVNVTINPGANITGDVFGCNNAAGAPQGAVNVVVNGTSALRIHNVYGGGNEAAYSGTPSLTVNGCSAIINDLYGGGNAAATGGTNAVVNGGTIARAFGGGNGESGTAADVNGNSSLTIHGGTISQVFGGSNSNGTVSGTMALNIDHTSACEENITDVYGGGNMAPGKVAVLTIGCGAGPFVNVFGGSNNANVSGNIVLNITGGTITNVFGGNNTGGTIDGTVTVNVSGGHLTNVFGENNAGGNVTGKVTVNIEQNDLEDCEHLTLDYVYGGGKNAAYNPSTPGDYPEVNLIKGVVNHDVFGGGLGKSATVTSNPTVNMRPTEKANFTVLGNIYGGGSAAPVNGSTSLTISNGTIGTMGSTSPKGGYVFGGGLGQTAVVSGNTRVQVTGNTDVEKNVYGGGNGGEVQGDTKVIIGE